MSSIVEATGLGLFLYHPLAWCFLRGMKKPKIILVASIVVAAVLIKTQTNLWRTETFYYEDGSKKKIEIVYENGKQISRKNF